MKRVEADVDAGVVVADGWRRLGGPEAVITIDVPATSISAEKIERLDALVVEWLARLSARTKDRVASVAEAGAGGTPAWMGERHAAVLIGMLPETVHLLGEAGRVERRLREGRLEYRRDSLIAWRDRALGG